MTTTQTRLDIDIRRLTPRIGAVITGVDLASGVDVELAEVLRQSLLAHRVIFLPGQHLDEIGHLDVANSLGVPTKAHPTLPSSPSHSAIFDLDSTAGASANHWHTDVTFVEQPPTYSILRAVVIPEVGGDTLWANTVTAYNDLRPDLQVLANSLRAVHTNGQDYGRKDVNAGRTGLRPELAAHQAQFTSTIYEAEHPVVRVHPETDEPALLLGGFAQRLVGHNSAETVDLLRTFASYVTRPENTVRWHWHSGDVAIWDNRATQHYAIYDYGTEHRRVERITTAGSRAVGLDGTQSRALMGDADAYYSAS